MAEGIRTTQGAGSDPRITQAGDTRITERAVMMGPVVMTAQPVMGAVSFTRRRFMGAVMTAQPAASVALRGKVALGAVMSTAGSASVTSLQARRGMGAVMGAAAQAFVGMGRTRPLCVQMHAHADMDLHATRRRSVQVPMLTGAAVEFTVRKRARLNAALTADTAMAAGQDAPLTRRRSVWAAMSTEPALSPIPLRKRAFVSTHMTTLPTVTFGRDETGVYRLLEDGQPRVTEAGSRRLVEESFAWGNIVVVHPPFRIFSHAGGLWYVLKPSAKEGNWQLPQGISVHWQGGWRDVISNK